MPASPEIAPAPRLGPPTRAIHQRQPRTARCLLTLRFCHPCCEPMELRVTDFNESGIGLLLPHLPLCRIATGDCWRHARLAGIDAAIGTLVLEIRHVATTAAGELRIGAAILEASGGALRRLRQQLHSDRGAR